MTDRGLVPVTKSCLAAKLEVAALVIEPPTAAANNAAIENIAINSKG